MFNFLSFFKRFFSFPHFYIFLSIPFVLLFHCVHFSVMDTMFLLNWPFEATPNYQFDVSENYFGDSNISHRKWMPQLFRWFHSFFAFFLFFDFVYLCEWNRIIIKKKYPSEVIPSADGKFYYLKKKNEHDISLNSHLNRKFLNKFFSNEFDKKA